jgi:hypothetical protein
VLGLSAVDTTQFTSINWMLQKPALNTIWHTTIVAADWGTMKYKHADKLLI